MDSLCTSWKGQTKVALLTRRRSFVNNNRPPSEKTYIHVANKLLSAIAPKFPLSRNVNGQTETIVEMPDMEGETIYNYTMICNAHCTIPALPADLLADQFAYRPTCSTTAALVALEHHTAQYLESASFVRCLLIDYSKAFDTISHPTLFQKLLDLNLKPNIVTWICNFLTGRTHALSLVWRNSVTLETYHGQHCTRVGNWTLPLYHICKGP